MLGKAHVPYFTWYAVHKGLYYIITAYGHGVLLVHIELTVGTNVLDPMQSSILKYCAMRKYISPCE